MSILKGDRDNGNGSNENCLIWKMDIIEKLGKMSCCQYTTAVVYSHFHGSEVQWGFTNL